MTECHDCGETITHDEHGAPCPANDNGHVACSAVCD
jgi:hypothetical protein